MHKRPTQVIFTADDFGFCGEVNEAVERGHRDGVLSAASLMVGAPATQDAIARARRMPRLAVGLHLTLVEGRPVLPAAVLPALTMPDGAFHDDLVGAGVRWFFSRAARRQLRAEIRAQFEAFRATGLTLDHVNAHNHMHLHPTVLGLIIDLAKEFDVRAVRLPYEAPAAMLAPWMGLMKRRLKRAGLSFNDRVVGMHATGHVNENLVLNKLAALPPGATEFYLHPAVRTTPALEAAAPGYDRAGELAALTSARVGARLKELALTPACFRDLS
ncbi:MAG: hopanoid biosynthesis-associated protein HpnK [Rhodospirillaceae bacterium]